MLHLIAYITVTIFISLSEIKDLFEYYMKPWKSWYAQVPQEKNQLLKEVH